MWRLLLIIKYLFLFVYETILFLTIGWFVVIFMTIIEDFCQVWKNKTKRR